MSTLKPNSSTRLFLCIVFVFFQCQLELINFSLLLFPGITRCLYTMFITRCFYSFLLCI